MDRLLAAKGEALTQTGQARRDIRSKLTLTRLPTMSPVLVQLLELCQDEELNIADLSTLISRDVGLVARIFSISTSAAFQGRSRPATLDQCLSLLGMRTIKTLVINESVMQVFNRFANWKETDLSEFWEHSLRVALIARELAYRLSYPNPEEAYLGGLVHDIGRLALLATEPEHYQRIFREYTDGPALCAVEHEAFSLTHVEIGAWLVEKWELDSFLGDSVLYHHEPIERMTSAPPLARIVLLADYLATSQSQFDPSVLALGGVAIDNPAGLLETVERELATVAEQLGIHFRSAPANEPAEKADAVLAARLQDMLLVNQVLSDSALVGSGYDKTIQAVAQAIKLLFDLDVALSFEQAGADGTLYRAKPLAGGSQRLSQLEFRYGSSAALLARVLDGAPQIVMRGGELQVLDDQVVRSLGGEGMLLLPLRTKSSRLGVLVAAIADADQAAALTTKLSCLGYFARMSALIAEQERLQAQPSSQAEGGSESRLHRLIHELNNPLAIIRNYVAILESTQSNQGGAQPELAIVRDEIDRVAHMLRSAREQQAEGVGAPGPVKLNKVIEDLATLFRGSIPFAGLVEIKLELAANLPDILSDRDRLKQLLVNLLKNAIEAMPQGGRVDVSTAPWGFGETGASHVEIKVEDNGPGIPKEVLAQLYKPVASQKEGGHQGLGLAIVGQLVRDLNGLINCRSGAHGTRFQVLLPLERK